MKTDSKAYYRLNNAISQCKRTVVEHRLGRHLSCVLVRENGFNVSLAFSRFSAHVVRLEMDKEKSS